MFQRLTEAVRFTQRNRGYDVINFVDDIIGFDINSTAERVLCCSYDLLEELDFEISKNKLIPPSCLGFLIKTEAFTVSVPADKLKISWAKFGNDGPIKMV